MDCTALSSDIDHLKSLRDTLQTQLAQATETGQGKSAILSAQAEATAVTDQLLEKYLPNFFEHNPELIEIQLGPHIEGFVDMDGDHANIDSIAPLPDGSALVGGNYGTLHRCYQDSSSHWQLGPLIDDFKDTNGARCSIKSIAPLPDGSALVGGFYGSLHRCYQDSSGHWQLGPLIEGFVDKDGYAMNIYSIAPLPDGSTLVGGGRGALHKATQSEPSLSTIKQSLDQIIAKGESYA